MDEELHDHDRGLGFDLPTLFERRRLFTLFAGAGLAAVIAGCGSDTTLSCCLARSTASGPQAE